MRRNDLTFRVFVSSTFSDLVDERNALQENVFPRLREFCEQRGARFQAVDLRWGVAREAALDQQTWNICEQELQRCQQVSRRPNFIVLLGNRYGWRPLPTPIAAEEFELLLQQLDQQQQASLTRWYRRDDNAIPPEYCLAARGGEFVDHQRWSQEESQLRGYLTAAVETVFPAGDPRREKYERSATHQEIHQGALAVDDAGEHVYCYFREIEDLPASEQAARYREFKEGEVDADSQSRLEALKAELREKLPQDNVFDWRVCWRNDALDYGLEALCDRLENDLKRVILQELDAFEKTSDLEREIAAHQTFGQSRAEHFVGRQDILKKIADYLSSDDRSPLVVHGRSGSGKTALLAQACQEHCALASPNAVLSRFIGATPTSTDLRSLLTGLCQELGRIIGDNNPPPGDLNELSQEFIDRLGGAAAEQPVVVFLDALDQIHAQDHASSLYWLPQELPTAVKLIASIAQTDSEPGDKADDCFQSVKRICSPNQFVELGPLSVEQGESLLGAWLNDARRTLQPQQRRHLLERFIQCPFPLYLKLAFEEARQWKSYDVAPDLGVDIPAVIDGLLERLEEPQHHGKVLTRQCMAYLRAARRGLAEDELLDVLSLNPDGEELSEVVHDFRRRSPDSPPVDRLPAVIWSRLFADLQPYLMHYETHGARLLSFYHRQIAQAVEKRYLTGEAAFDVHHDLAKYFDQQDYWRESLERQRERAGRAPPTPRPANARKVDELPWQLLQVVRAAENCKRSQSPEGEYERLEAFFNTPDFLEAKVESGLVFDLAAEFAEVVSALPDDRLQWQILRLIHEALWREIHFIHRHPTALFQCLWNLCWWYDCPAEENYYQESFMIRGPSNRSGIRLHRLLERWLLSKEQNTPGFPWIRSLRPPKPHLGSAVRGVLRTNKSRIRCVAYSPNGRQIACGAEDGNIHVWDARSLQRQFTIRASDFFGVTSIAYSPDGRVLISGGDSQIRLWFSATGAELRLAESFGKGVRSCVFSPDGSYIAADEKHSVVVWEVITGKEVYRMDGHEYSIESIAFSPTGDRLASASGDYTLRIWRLSDGAELQRIYTTDAFFSVAFSPDGKQLVSGASDNAVRVWDATTGFEQWNFRGNNGWVRSVQFSPNGELIAAASNDGAVRLLDATSRQLSARLEGHTDWVSSVTFSPNGSEVASASFGGSVIVWDVQTAITTPVRTLINHSQQIRNVSFSKDGRWAASSANDDTIRLWNAADGGDVTVITDESEKSPRGYYGAEFSSNGRFLAALNRNYSPNIWELTNQQQLLPIRIECPYRVFRISFSPNNRTIATGSDDKLVRIWDIETQEVLHELSGHEHWAVNVVFSADGRRLASCSDSSTDRSVRVWDAVTGEQLAGLRYKECGFETLAFSPDGARLAAGALNDDILVWDAESYSLLHVLEGHQALIVELAFSNDHRSLISRSRDGTTRIWRLDENESEIILGLCDPLAIVEDPSFRVVSTEMETKWGRSAETEIGWLPTPFQALRARPAEKLIAAGDGQHFQLLRLENGANLPEDLRRTLGVDASDPVATDHQPPTAVNPPESLDDVLLITLTDDRFAATDELKQVLAEFRRLKKMVRRVSVPHGQILTTLKTESHIKLGVDHTANLESALRYLTNCWLDGHLDITAEDMAACLYWACRMQREDQLYYLTLRVPVVSPAAQLARDILHQTQYGPAQWGPNSEESPNAAVFFEIASVSAIRLSCNERTLQRIVVDHAVKEQFLYPADSLADWPGEVLAKYILPQCCGLQPDPNRRIDFEAQPLSNWRVYDDPNWQIGLVADA